jgi:hypothetical protein
VGQERAAVPIRVQGAQSLDSARQRYHHALWILRDSVAAVRLAVETFQRDAASVSPETVLSRAQILRGRCSAATRALAAAEPLFAPSKAPERPPQTRAGAAALVRAMQALRSQLETHCQRGFASAGPGARADSIRAWAGYKGSQVEKALTAYERAVSDFTVKADFRLEPAIPKR